MVNLPGLRKTTSRSPPPTDTEPFRYLTTNHHPTPVEKPCWKQGGCLSAGKGTLGEQRNTFFVHSASVTITIIKWQIRSMKSFACSLLLCLLHPNLPLFAHLTPSFTPPISFLLLSLPLPLFAFQPFLLTRTSLAYTAVLGKVGERLLASQRALGLGKPFRRVQIWS